MIYTPLTKKAIIICFNAHKEQTDKTGLPYVFHPFHLAEQMDDEYSTCVALLHDVVEDSEITINDLKDAGFPSIVIEAVNLMTHDKSEKYMDYVAKIKENELARKVKIADLTHNMDITRLDKLTEFDLKRNEKYQKAREYLLK